jgi:glutathione-regulated potassium-efflux system ancillary protein KefG
MNPKSSVLIIFAHPAFQKSRVNKLLVQAVRQLKGIYFHDLYEVYPDFGIDPKKEQALLTRHDIIVLQFPFFWYSTPAIIKEWEDIVLEHGWAFGSKGKALHGKKLICALSTGGREEAYAKGGYNRFSIRQLLVPLEQCTNLCGMDFLPPFVTHGTHFLAEPEILSQVRKYARLVRALRDGRICFDKLAGLDTLHAHLDKIILPEMEMP